MRNFLQRLVFPLLLALLAASCAKTEDPPYGELRDEAFVQWMKKYHPEVERLESGLYVEWIRQNPSGRRLNEGYWMMLNYTGYELDGDIYNFRSGATARQMINMDTYPGYNVVHYVPEYLQYSLSTDGSYTTLSKLTLGQVEILRSMHEGDSVRLYVPPSMGYMYGYTNLMGYDMNATLVTTNPLIIEMGLKEVVPDPLVRDRDLTYAYARDSLGIPSPADSVAYGVYMKKLTHVPEGDTITKDSTVSVYYITRFLDGFLVDTNIDSVAVAANMYTAWAASNTGTAHFTAKSWMPYSSSGSSATSDNYPTDGLSAMLVHMRCGERAVGVVISSQAYGADGSTNGEDAPLPGYLGIPPYTPLVFEIYIEPKINGETPEEE